MIFAKVKSPVFIDTLKFELHNCSSQFSAQLIDEHGSICRQMETRPPFEKDEEVVRKTVKTINEKIVEFKTMFVGKDMQDYVSMVLIWYATELTGKEAPLLETAQLSDKLTAIEKLINEQLDDQ